MATKPGDSSSPSLDDGTKLATGRWRLVVYPDAREAVGVFQSAREPIASFAAALDRDASPQVPDLSAAWRARTKVRRYCVANRLVYFWTLTYPGDGEHDPKHVRTHIRSFFRRLRGVAGEALPYVWVTEWHKTDHGLHVHFAINRFVDQAIVERIWRHGYVWVEGPSGWAATGAEQREQARRVASYIAKYLTKDVGRTPAGMHRYEVAQGFQPRSVVFAGTSPGDLYWKAFALMGGLPEIRESSEIPDWDGPPAVWMRWP
jgi:hypothetical protein